ncbi:MAG: hypothetical protein GC159_13340 [Phycisphaera sp.]|nr:hypothetical protein [Phycisphaera sp.]
MDIPVLLLADDLLAGDAEPTVTTDEHAAGEVVVDLIGAAVLAVQQPVAFVERRLVDQRFVLADVQFASEPDQAGVDRVVKDVRHGVAAEAGLAGSVDEALPPQGVADLLKGLGSRRVQLEDTPNRLGVDRVELDGVVSVAGDVDVTEGR